MNMPAKALMSFEWVADKQKSEPLLTPDVIARSQVVNCGVKYFS